MSGKTPASMVADSVNLIKRGKSTVAREARRHGVTKQAVSQWVKKSLKPAPSPDGEPGPVQSDPAIPVTEPKLETGSPALVPLPSMGAGPAIVSLDDSPPGDDEPDDSAAEVRAREDDERFVLEVANGAKKTVMGLSVPLILKLDSNDPEVNRHYEIGTVARETLKSNAALIAPELRKHINGWGVVAMVMAMDTGSAVVELVRLAKKRGTIGKKKTDETEAKKGNGK